MAFAEDEYDDENDLSDRDLPDEADRDDDDGDGSPDETEPCPFCKKPVHETADVCPYCRNFISLDEPQRKPWWVFVVLLLCLLAMLMWVVR